MSTPRLHDTHCHLGFMTNGTQVATDAQTAGTLLFANTVTPGEWRDAHTRFGGLANVTVGFGMHPWWVEDGSAEPAPGEGDDAPISPDNTGAQANRQKPLSQRASHRKAAERMAAQSEVDSAETQRQRASVLGSLAEADPATIGEIGLDFGWSHIATRPAQLRMLSEICTWAANRGDKLLSIHAVRAAQEAFDVLERTGALESCTCIFHWFTGPSDLLKRAVRGGCYFSCGPRMLATAKGREYVKAIPARQLLLETDAPPKQGMSYSYEELHAELAKVAEAVAAIKGPEALDVIAGTSERLLAKGR